MKLLQNKSYELTEWCQHEWCPCYPNKLDYWKDWFSEKENHTHVNQKYGFTLLSQNFTCPHIFTKAPSSICSSPAWNYEKSLKKKEKEKNEEKKMFKIKPPNFIFEFKKINNTDWEKLYINMSYSYKPYVHNFSFYRHFQQNIQ